jgi:hypothetical protein
MKSTLIGLAGMALSVAFFAPAGHARTQPRATTQSPTETFIGQISKEPIDRAPVPYILYDQNRKTNYFIENGGKVGRYNGKEVEIKGTLDQANDTINVKSVKELR